MLDTIRKSIRKDQILQNQSRNVATITNLSDSDVYEGGIENSIDNYAFKAKHVTNLK